MNKGRSLAIAATALTLGLMMVGTAAGAQSSAPSTADVAKAKVALKKFVAANAPKTEDAPTDIAECPFGDQFVNDLVARQLRYDEQQSTPAVTSSVYVDQTVDKGLRSLGCTVEYSEDSFDTPRYLSIVVYADPKVKTTAYSKALAKQRDLTASPLTPPEKSVAGGKVEGYCLKSKGIPDACSHVWNRNGLYVEIDTSVLNSGNFDELPAVVAQVVDSLNSSGS